MVKALQVGFGEPVGAAVLADVRGLGVQMVRIGSYGLTRMPDAETANAMVNEVLVAGLRPLVVIRPEHASWFPPSPTLDLEVLNEPDLTGMLPEAYAAQVNAVYATVAGRHRIWAGSLSNLIPKRLAWLARVLALVPPQVCVSVHRYPKNGATPNAPQEGFKTRAAEMDALRRVVGTRPWGVSEFGYHTGPQRTGHWFWTKRWQWTDTQVAAFARAEWLLWRNAGAQWACWYQIGDGPVDPYRYGIRTFDGRWKPVSETFR